MVRDRAPVAGIAVVTGLSEPSATFSSTWDLAAWSERRDGSGEVNDFPLQKFPESVLGYADLRPQTDPAVPLACCFLLDAG